MTKHFFYSLLAIAALFPVTRLSAQAGITASPTRLYFKPGEKQEQKIVVSNPSKEKTLEVGLSLSDWNYDSLGNNMSYDAGTLSISCAQNIMVQPGSYFSLKPGETKELSISIKDVTPQKDIPVRTAMLYLTQLNPGDGQTETGAAIKVTVRMGVKVYYTERSQTNTAVEISNFITEQGPGKLPNGLKLYVNNIGDIWLNGTIHYDLLNKNNGKKYQIPEIEFYSLPGDKRVFQAVLPKDMDHGSYTATAIVQLANSEELKLAELDFDY